MERAHQVMERWEAPAKGGGGPRCWTFRTCPRLLIPVLGRGGHDSPGVNRLFRQLALLEAETPVRLVGQRGHSDQRTEKPGPRNGDRAFPETLAYLVIGPSTGSST